MRRARCCQQTLASLRLAEQVKIRYAVVLQEDASILDAKDEFEYAAQLKRRQDFF